MFDLFDLTNRIDRAGGRGGSDAPLPLWALVPDSYTGEMLGVRNGVGMVDVGRSSGRMAWDVENRLYSVPAYEAAIHGGRVVRNLLGSSENFESGDWSAQSGASIDGNELTFTQSISALRQYEYGTPFTAPSSQMAAVILTLTNEYKRYSVAGTVEGRTYIMSLKLKAGTTNKAKLLLWASSVNGATFLVYPDTDYDGHTIFIDQAQLENSTGRADLTTPSEYCPNDTAVGGDFVTNGGFDTATDWNVYGEDASGNPSEISGGVLTLRNDGTNPNRGVASQEISFKEGTKYRVSFSIASVAGGFYLRTSSHPSDTTGVDNLFENSHVYGQKVVTFTASADATYLKFFQALGATYVHTIDNVVVTEASTGRKVFANENGNSVASNVVTDAVGSALTEQPWFDSCPAATNSQIWSNDQTNAVWNTTRGVVTKDQIGLSKLPNTACRIVDDGSEDPAGAVYVYDNPEIVSGQQNCLVVKAKKDQLNWTRLATSGFDSIQRTWFDLDNGVIGQIDGGGNSAIVDLGNGFYKVIMEFSSTTDVIGNILVGPADSDGEHVVDLDGTSSIIIDSIEIYKNKTIPEVRNLPSIPTEGSADSIEADGLTLDILNHNNDEVCYYCEWSPGHDYDENLTNNSILTVRATAASIMYENITQGRFLSYDGAHYTSNSGNLFQTNDTVKLGVIASISDGKMHFCVNGVWGVLADYDGYGITAALELMRLSPPAKMRNLKRFNIIGSTAQKAKIDELMA